MALLLASVVAITNLAAQTGQPATAPVPIPGRNINMVSGDTFPDGDPFLQRQNEPSIAVSTRNPLHVFGASNDYRTVDIPGLVGEVNGDAWIGIFKSFDGGSTWRSTLLPGFPLDGSPQGATSPLKGLEAGADPVVRAGTNGLFYLSGIAFNRASSADGKVFIARYIDNNNLEAGDPILYLGTSVIDVGSATRFLDKPWIAVDIPRGGGGGGGNSGGNGNGGHGGRDDDRRDGGRDDDRRGKGKDDRNDDRRKDDMTDNGSRRPFIGPTCQIPGQAQPIPAGPVYVMYSVFISPGTTATATTGSSTTTGGGRDRDRDSDGDRGPYRNPRGDRDWDGDRGRDHGGRDHDHDEHQPGQPMEGRTQIMFARSLDCGATFSQPTKISDRTQINQGSVAAIDPNTGAIYVAWREFLSAAQPDAILVTKSIDGGLSFSTPVTIARIAPFDQSTSPTRFRTNSYPSITVDGDGRVYVAWAQRNVGPYGDARIVISTSTDGRLWTAPAAADNHAGYGHQFMPVLSSGGGRIHLVFWDQRDDVSGDWGPEIDDGPVLATHVPGYVGPRKLRHTIDLYAVAGLPGNPPQFGASRRLSDYPRGSRNGSQAVEQMQFNAPNLPLFSQGTKPFIGDYLDVTASPNFVANGDGTWRFNTQSSDPSVYFASWSDNRDVRGPGDGNWSNYTAPTFGLAPGIPRSSTFDPSQLVMCTPGQAGMRNQNIYSTRVTTGLIATMLGNTKPLGLVQGKLIQRTFVATVANPDATRKSIVLHIPSQPVGGVASFLQFSKLTDLPVMIEAKSSISREVYVTSTDRLASVAITIEDVATHTTAARLLINPDITNPDIQNPDIQNPDIQNPDIQNAEVHAISVSNPDIQNPDIQNPDIQNPDIQNPDIQNPDIQNPDIQNLAFANPDIINPDIQNPDIQNPDIQNPDIQNPDIQNPDIQNASLTDVTWKVSNIGNTSTAYQVRVLLDQAAQARLIAAGVQFQLIIAKSTKVPVVIDQCAVAQPSQTLTVASIKNPSFTDPANPLQFASVVNPDIQNPDIQNTTVALAPGEDARVTLRVYSPAGDKGTDPGTGTGDTSFTGALEDLNKVGVVTTSHPVDTTDANNNIQTPQITASIPLIVTTTLPDGARTLPYPATALDQTGSTEPFSFAVVTGELPPGLSLSPAGLITGTPTASGSFTFGVRLTDASGMTANATLTIRVFEPVSVGTPVLPGAAVNQAYSAAVSAAGGFAPHAWAVTGGALPTGVSLSSAGGLSGTPTQSGNFAFTATATDAAAPPQMASAAMTLNVTPSANPQSVTLAEETATPIILAGTGAAPGAFSFAIGNQPAHGSVNLIGATATYTPASNYSGPDNFTFRVIQGALTSPFATVSLTVTAVNDPPTANPQAVFTHQSTFRDVILTGSDPEDSPLTFAINTGPTHGTLTVTPGFPANGPNRRYTPTTGYTGPDSFTFHVNDGVQNGAIAAVSITVGNPAPGTADVSVTLADAPDPVVLGNVVTYTATVLNSDISPATATGVALTFSYPSANFSLQTVTPPAGTTCTPTNPIVCTLGPLGTLAPNQSAIVTFALRATDGGGGTTVTTSASVTATQTDYNPTNNSATQITLVNGSPTADLSVSQTRTPLSGAVDFGADAVYTVVVSNGGPSAATGITLNNVFSSNAVYVSSTATQGGCSPSGSQVACNVGALAAGTSATYTVTLRANGAGSFTNTATVTGSQSDPNLANNSAALATTVNNRAPIATSDVATTTEEASAAIAVLSNDTDPDGNALTVTGATQPAHGSTTVNPDNTVSYTPAPNYNGLDGFSYTIDDGLGGTATTGVSINVIAVNDAPGFAKGPDIAVSRTAGAQTVSAWATAITRGPADESTQTIGFIVGNSNHALFSAQPDIAPNGTLTYTPSPTATAGSATVTVWLQDDGGTLSGGIDTSAAQTFTITTTAANQSPTAANDTASVNEDAPPTAIHVLDNDDDPDHDTLAVTGTTPPLHGTAVLNLDDTTVVVYTPAAHYNGPDSFTYTISDGHGGTATASVDVTVTAVNDAPSFTRGADVTMLEDAGTFVPVGSLATGRVAENNVTGLTDGRVLISGGIDDSNFLQTAEVYDPATRAFGPTGSLSVARFGHTSTLLPDGRVLIAGGVDNSLTVQATAETYNPVTGAFTAVASLLNNARYGHTATLLPSGKVLLAGGLNPSFLPTASAELFDPATNTFALTGNALAAPRATQTATRLADGRVVLVGGYTTSGNYVAAADVYDPTTNHFTTAGSLATPRGGHTATLLPNGRVLIAGGDDATVPLSSTEFFDPSSGLFVPGPSMSVARDAFAAALLPDGTVLVAGGRSDASFSTYLASAELFDFRTNVFTPTASMAHGRTSFALTPLNGGAVLAAGGFDDVGVVPASELFARAGMQVVPTWATGISAGPPDESGQTIDFLVSPDNPGLFAAGPAVAANGTLTFTPAANANGLATVTVRAHDSGGTTAGGVNTSAAQAFTITITAVNDPPSFVAGPNQTIANTAGPQSVASWATAISPGPPDEAGQAIDFLVTTDNNALFAALPAVTAAGTLTYQPASGATGVATVTVQAHDNGGTADGGTDRSLAQTLTITVTSGNQTPVATDDAAITTTDSPLVLYPAANDSDPDNPRPTLLQTVRALAPGTPNLTGPGEVTVVNSTGLGYFGSNNAIGIFDTGSNTIIGSIPLQTLFNTVSGSANQATKLVYLRFGGTLVAVDGRPASPTFNTAVLSLVLGTGIQAMAIDEPHGRLYAAAATNTTGTVQQSRIVVLDINPASATFHQIVNQLPVPGIALVAGLAVNTVTNKLYVMVASGPSAGLNVLDGVTFSSTLISNTIASIGSTQTVKLGVNESSNLVYAPGPSSNAVFAVDGVTNTVLSTIAIPVSASVGPLTLNSSNGRVYVRMVSGLNASVVVIDGTRGSPTFNTVIAQVPNGRDSSVPGIAVDASANRLITTSAIDHKVTIFDATTIAPIASIQMPQAVSGIGLNSSIHRAYITGGTGVLQVIDLTAASLLASVQTGIEVDYLVVDPATDSAYVPRTGLTTDIQVVGAAGQLALIAPNSDGVYLGRARNAVTNRIYVPNLAASSPSGSTDALPGYVTVIDGATRNVIANVPAGNHPGTGAYAIAIDESQNKIYVGNLPSTSAFPGGITVIDGSSHATSAADLSLIPLTSPTSLLSVARLAVNPATGKVYFAVSGSTATLAVMNGATNVATALPVSFGSIVLFRVNPNLNRVYVVAQASGQPVKLHVLDGATDAEIAIFDVGARSPLVGSGQSYVALNRVTGRVFAANYDLNTLTVIDGASNSTVATIPVGHGPTSVAVNEASNRVYVANGLDKTLMLINGATLRVESIVSLPLQPVDLGVDESPARVFAVGGCISASSACVSFDAGVMVIDDPGSPNGPLSVTAVTQGANGSVALNADGSVTYTPNAGFSGSDTYTYTLSDGHGGTTTGNVNVTVATPVHVGPATLPATTTGSSYSQVFVATGGTAPYAWSLSSGALPGGVQLNAATGSLSGTALQSGTFTFTVQAADSSTPPRVGAQAYSVIVGPPVVTTTSLPSATIGTPYSQQLGVGGATGAVSWTLDTNNSPLLTWLSLSAGGVLSGTPPSYGTTPPFTVTVTDSLNQSGFRSLSLSVSGPLGITPTTLREGVVLESAASLPIVGGSGTRTVTLTGGTLPPGVSLTSSGGFTGSPTRHGTFTFSVQVVDSTATITRNLTWRVSPKDQQGSSQTQSPITFGGAGGRRVAQTVTVGAAGTLTGIGLRNISCSSQGPVTAEIQRLTLAGLPDGNTIASGVSFNSNFNAISVAPAIDLPIDATFAFILSSPTACTLNNAATTDQYNAGDAYVDSGGGWVSLFSTDGRYDVPSFVTLIQPAMDVAYLNASRSGHAAILLNTGKVLLAGGGTMAELYDPSTNTSTPTGNMLSSHGTGVAALLADGTVLVAGGCCISGTSTRFNTAETYDPVSGSFTATANTMTTARDSAAAVRLPDGRVLIVGGYDGTQSLFSAEIYNPATRTFSAIGNMVSGRNQTTATLLANGKVLIAGGYTSGSKSAELYDPATGTFTATAGNMVVFGRGGAAASLLLDGRVLITGGQSGDIVASAEIYDPVTDSFTATAGSMTDKRQSHTSTTLADGSVLISGGWDALSVVSNYTLGVATLERYIPGSNAFVAAGSMETRRVNHRTLRLPSDRVLITGGSSQSWMSGDTAELYDVTAVPALTTTVVPDGQVGVAYPGATLAAAGGGGPPYQIAVVPSTLPPGLVYAANTFALSGTPSATGLYQAEVRVTDAASHTNVQSLPIRVGTINVITSPYRLIDGALNHAYSLQLTASGAAPLTWSFLAGPNNNPMPPGLSLSSAGVISGTVSSIGFYNFEVRAVDATGQAAVKGLSINIQNALVITTTTLPEGVVLESNTFCLSASNGIGTRTWSVVTSSPVPGIALQSNGCNTAPAATGTFSFRAQVADSASPSQIVTQDYVLRVSARDQQAGGPPQPAITFGGPGGRTLAQVVTVGANGMLTGFGFNFSAACSASLITVDVQRLTLAGVPDGTTIATGTSVISANGIALTPAIPVSIDQRLAFVASSGGPCTIVNALATDDYQAGDAYVNAGAGWTPLIASDGRYDIPFRTLIQPAVPVVYLNSNRGALTTTRLGNGKVLIAGGNTSTAELYDPATNISAQTGSMSVSRQTHTATLLANGTVLIVGGRNSTGTRLASAEIFDPSTNTFGPTNGSMASAREYHVATLLPSGRVLMTGGVDSGGFTLQTAELYDPTSKTFSSAGNMTTARQSHAAVALQSGKVLIAGGFGNQSNRTAEIYDPAAGALGTFTTTAGQMVVPFLGNLTATLLLDGRVLIAGGSPGSQDARAEAELYNPATDQFSATGAMTSPRIAHTATLLPDGSVLVTGGDGAAISNNYELALATRERYLPGSNTWVPAGVMETRRHYHSAVALANGQILLAGGFGQSWMTGDTAELYDLGATPSLTTTSLPDGQVGVPYPTTVLAATGGSGPPYQIARVSGVLPGGMSYDAPTFTMSGTPGAGTTGTYPIGFTVTDSASHSSAQSLTLRVGSVLVITSSRALPDGALNHAYDATLAASGTAPIVWSLAPSSTLPPGLSVVNIGGVGHITGTSTSVGFYNFDVRAIDATGQVAFKTLSISIQSPLAITATTLPEAVLFQSNAFCLSAFNGIGSRTWSVVTSSPAPGFSLQTNGCSAAPIATGTFTFTAQVTDSLTPPQVATQDFVVHVSAQDQSAGSNNSLPGFAFGGGGVRIAERVTTGVTGLLRGFRVNGITCPPDTTLTVDVQGIAVNGGPDGSTIATGTGLASSGTILFGTPPFFNADQPFTLVVGSSAACTVQPSSFDSYGGGDGFAGSPWQLLADYSGGSYFDIPFQTLVLPPPAMSFTTAFRSGGVAAALAGGRVLLSSSGTSEIFDSTTQTFAASGNMIVSRSGYTATPLDDGTVLFTGGFSNGSGAYLASAELYHPDTGVFELLGSSMSTGRGYHTATKLSCPPSTPACSWAGKVLIAGGYFYNGSNFSALLASMDLYDPATKSFSSFGTLSTPRYLHTATLLQCPAGSPNCAWGGMVLVGGGFTSSSSLNGDLINPALAIATPTGSMRELRYYHTATQIPDGRVLFAGGYDNATGSGVAEAELFDPQQNSFASAGSQLSTRVRHTADLLADGSVLLAGGSVDFTNMPPVASMERFVPGSGFVGAGSMWVTRQSHTSTSLPGGLILMVGGSSNSNLTGRAAEIITPAQAPSLVNPLLPTGNIGTPYQAVIAPRGGSGQPYTFALASSAQSLPPGLSLDTFTCLVGCSVTVYTSVSSPVVLPLTAPIQLARISGTPTAAGNYSFDLRVFDSSNRSADQTVTVRINPLNIVTPTQLTNAYLGLPYTLQLTATGTGTLTWSLLPGSTLPNGLTLSSSGVISGTPHQTNFGSFSVRVTDGAGQTAIRQFFLSTSYWTDQGSFGDGVSVNTLAIGAGSRIAQTVMTGVTGYLGGVVLQTLSCSTNPVVVTIQGVSPTTGAPDDGQIFATTTATITGSFQVIPLPTSIFFAADSRFAIVLSSATGSCQVTNAAVGTDTSAYQDGAAFQDLGGGWSRLSDGPTGIADIQFQTIATNDALIHTSYVGAPRAVRLQSGKVLFVGNNGVAELYDPATNRSTSRTMLARRGYATATLLNSGKVLVTGGADFSQPFPYPGLTSAELYDPALDVFVPVAGTMSTARLEHRAVLLADGRVLIAGGVQTWYANTLNSAEIFDPATSTFSPAAPMLETRERHEMTLLGDGRVLVSGGFGSSFSGNGEIYSPALGTWTTANLLRGRAGHTATRLPNGTVFLAGGYATNNSDATSNAEIYDPGTNISVLAGSLVEPRAEHTATLLADGSVLLTGGYRNSNLVSAPWATAERYVPATGFVGAASMLVTRYYHAAARLADGRVIIGGGFSNSAQSSSTLEVYDPRPGSGNPGILNPNLPDGSKDVVYGPVTFAPTAGAGQPYTLALVPPANALPPGLSFDVVSCLVGCTLTDGTPVSAPIQLGRIQGTPTAVGSYAFDVRVTDQLGRSSDQTLRIRVNGLDILTTFLPEAHLGQAYLAPLSATGVAPVTWTVVGGALPPGLSIVGSSISGTLSPSAVLGNNYNVVIRAIDAAGQRAVRSLWIYVQSALQITTTTLNDGILFEGYGGCLNAINGSGFPFTWTITSGSLPPGVTLQSNGCFNNQPDGLGALGAFSFTAQVTDQSSPPQVATRGLNINVSLATDQSSSWDGFQPSLAFGSNGIVIAERVITGITGTLRAMRLPGNNAICPAGAIVSVQIQGVTPGGAPDGQVIASGSASYPFITSYLPLSSGAPFAAGDTFAVVFNANALCSVQPASNDSYPGDGYVFNGGVWQRLFDYNGRYDIPFQTLIQPTQGLTFLTRYRGPHTATLLAGGPVGTNGKVLITGGGDQSAELYDPATRTTTATGNMNAPRLYHTATQLNDGTVLIAGGSYFPQGGGTVYLSSAEIYHPDTGTFETLPAAMSTVRSSHTATTLADGRVLIAGGSTSSTYVGTAEIYNPISRTFEPAINLALARTGHTATLLNDGRVLLLGGYLNCCSSIAAELFDPLTSTFAAAPNQPSLTFRSRHTATVLDDGTVLIAGGSGAPAATSAEIFNPLTGLFSSAGTMLNPRVDFTAAKLGDGSVLLAGGLNDTTAGCCPPIPPQPSMERYVPGVGFVPSGNMIAARYQHTASVLPNGKVLVAGTWGWSGTAGRSAELFPSPAVPAQCAAPAPAGVDGLSSVFSSDASNTPRFSFGPGESVHIHAPATNAGHQVRFLWFDPAGVLITEATDVQQGNNAPHETGLTTGASSSANPHGSWTAVACYETGGHTDAVGRAFFTIF